MTPTKIPTKQPHHVQDDAAMQELYKMLLKSEKFINWKPEKPEKPFTLDDLEQSNIMAEKYYTPDELSELWSVSTVLAQ